ncbi:MAG TPA: hypothetical protein VH637_24790 [Streptosporangiaceae bacterium]
MPSVTTTAATAATGPAAAPMARLSSPASGTLLAAPGPSTLIVAMASAR